MKVKNIATWIPLSGTGIMDNELNNSKLTLVVGATNNPERYAYKAAELLQSKGFDFLPIGIKKGMVLGKEILDLHQLPSLTGIHTLTLYLGPENQSEWIDYLIGIKPVRVLFNPGTENPLFFQKAREAGIDVQNVCTLVILTTGQF